MDRLNEINLGWLWVGFVLAGALLGGLAAAVRSLRDASQLVDNILRQPGEENPQP